MKAKRSLPKSWDLPGGGMGEVKARLEGEGFRIDGFTPLLPVQVWGLLPTGEPFYFHERHGTASFEIYGAGDLDELVGRVEEARWYAEIETPDDLDFEPGERPPSTDELILEFLRRYREGT